MKKEYINKRFGSLDKCENTLQVQPERWLKEKCLVFTTFSIIKW